MTPSVPVRVDYEPTPPGRSLLDTVRHRKERAEAHLPEVDRARAEYDRR